MANVVVPAAPSVQHYVANKGEIYLHQLGGPLYSCIKLVNLFRLAIRDLSFALDKDHQWKYFRTRFLEMFGDTIPCPKE